MPPRFCHINGPKRVICVAEEAVKEKRCAKCEKKLTKANSWCYPAKLGTFQGPFCLSCMENIFTYLGTVVGYKLALFYCCVIANMPYKPDLLEKAKEFKQGKGVLGAYVLALRSEKLHDTKTGFAGFSDGITDIKVAFGGEMEALEVDDEMLNDEEYKSGHLSQVRDWGYGPKDRPYTQTDYDLLDSFHEALTSDRVNVNDQAEMAIKNICIIRLEQRKAIEEGDISKAKQLEDIAIKEMESEQLRKKDEIPQDRVRIDDIILACERNGIPLMDYDALVETLATKMFHSPYGYTRDAADQMLLMIRNATAFNEGYAEVDRLPDEFAIQDPLGEFATEQDETEKQLYKDMHLTPLNMGGESQKGGV